VMERGHVRVGLEDAPFGCEIGNAEQVEAAARAIENAGGSLATAAEVRIASSADALEESA
jgi:3-keto-5-aminohexanoate cleavage enzyme